VSQTGTAMVLMRKQGTQKLNNGFGTPIMDLQIIPLKKGAEQRILPIGSKFGSLAASCGSALFLYRTTRDLVNGEDLDLKPYFDFRCSSNRREVVGEVELDSHGAVVSGLIPADSHSALVSGLPPNLEKPWVGNTGTEGFAYDTSPNGKYLAYYMPKELCLVEKQATKSCVPKIDALDQISVSDSGDIFFTTHTGATCNYKKDSFHVSLVPRPGYDSRGPCVGVAVLQKGKRSPDIVEPLGWFPQWLTPRAASTLMARRTRSISKFSERK